MDRDSTSLWRGVVVQRDQIPAAHCAYIEQDPDEPPFTCPVCTDVIPPNKVVQQQCPCRLKVCAECLHTWAESRLPRLPTCFTCRKFLDLSGIGGREVRYAVITPRGIRIPMAPWNSLLAPEVFGPSPNGMSSLIGFPRLATDNELELIERIWININRIRPGPEWFVEFNRQRFSTLDNSVTRLLDNVNTLYIVREPTREFLLIGANARIPHTALILNFFFFVSPNTSITELATLWNEIESRTDRAIEWGNSLFTTPNRPVGWTFNGRPMIWSDTISSLGMVEGDVFDILLQAYPSGWSRSH